MTNEQPDKPSLPETPETQEVQKASVGIRESLLFGERDEQRKREWTNHEHDYTLEILENGDLCLTVRSHSGESTPLLEKLKRELHKNEELYEAQDKVSLSGEKVFVISEHIPFEKIPPSIKISEGIRVDATWVKDRERLDPYERTEKEVSADPDDQNKGFFPDPEGGDVSLFYLESGSRRSGAGPAYQNRPERPTLHQARKTAEDIRHQLESVDVPSVQSVKFGHITPREAMLINEINKYFVDGTYEPESDDEVSVDEREMGEDVFLDHSQSLYRGSLYTDGNRVQDIFPHDLEWYVNTPLNELISQAKMEWSNTHAENKVRSFDFRQSQESFYLCEIPKVLELKKILAESFLERGFTGQSLMSEQDRRMKEWHAGREFT